MPLDDAVTGAAALTTGEVSGLVLERWSKLLSSARPADVHHADFQERYRRKSEAHQLSSVRRASSVHVVDSEKATEGVAAAAAPSQAPAVSPSLSLKGRKPNTSIAAYFLDATLLFVPRTAVVI